MVVSTEYELLTFAASVALGAALGILYDFFRAIRKCGLNPVLCDIVMWVSVVSCAAGVWFFVLDGQLRWYMILGALFSGIIYFLTLSPYVFFLLGFLADKICLFFRIIFKILLTPLGFLCKIVGVYICRAKSKFSKKVEEKYNEKKA